MEPIPSETGLGNLAQAARKKQLKTARGILLFVGIITVVVNIAFCVFADKIVDSQIDQEVAELRGQGMEIDNAAVAEVRASSIRSVQLANGIAVALGVVFIVCGIMVYQYPVPTTILSLVLYIGSAAVYGVVDPTTLARGWLIKIIIVVALFKAVQAALAYEKEQKQAESAPQQFAPT
jgi:hypothetical protein